MTETCENIGFVIVSHDSETKLRRLIQALNREYDSPSISIHHDFSQTPMDGAKFPANVRFVADWVKTGWARWSVVDAALRAFRSLFETSSAQWMFLLSAADYPIKRGAEVWRELSQSPYDAYIDVRPLVGPGNPRADLIGKPNPKLSHFDTPIVRAQKRRFYLSPQLSFPILRRSPQLRLGKWTYRPPFDGRHPFHGEVECFYGDHWFTINRTACAALLRDSELNRSLQSHFRNRTMPDECYYASLLANTPGLKICRDNRRFAEWRGGGAHPIQLAVANLAEMTASNGFFARKFGEDQLVLDELDRYIGAL